MRPEPDEARGAVAPAPFAFDVPAARAAWTDSAMASPRAVPPPAVRLAMAPWTWARSLVGARTIRASVEKATRPTRKPAGSWSTKVVAAALAASRRLGLTSVACIEPETSMARTTVASSRGTATVMDGRARAMPSAAMATR